MGFLDGDALTSMSSAATLQDSGHAARHNEKKTALEAIRSYLQSSLAHYVNHAADGTVDRPTINGTAVEFVIWIGSVEPSNAVAGDWWYDTANNLLKVAS